MVHTLRDTGEGDEKLIFDLGFFDGADSRFYIDKGFRVIAVEADRRAITTAQASFRRELESGALTLIDKAIWTSGDTKIPFYLDPRESSNWHSVYRPVAERAGVESIVEEVETTTVPILFD